MGGMDAYRKVRYLGKGSFGCAVLVQRVKDGARCVVKQVDVSKLPRAERDAAMQEAQLLGKLHHPNVVTCFESFVDGGKLCIVMDFCDRGDMYEFLKKRNGALLPEPQILDYFVQICLAIKHVHDRKVLHRDLKTQNIFMSKDGSLKVGDFGVSKVLAGTACLAYTAVGTPYYLSPEICENKPYNHKSDVWSLGCVLYELTTLKQAFDASTLKLLVLKIIRGNYPAIPGTYSKDLRELVAAMISKDPHKRPSVNDILAKPFLADRVAKFLQPDVKEDEFSHTVLHGRRRGGGLSPPRDRPSPQRAAPQPPAPVKPGLPSRPQVAPGQEASREAQQEAREAREAREREAREAREREGRERAERLEAEAAKRERRAEAVRREAAEREARQREAEELKRERERQRRERELAAREERERERREQARAAREAGRAEAIANKARVEAEIEIYVPDKRPPPARQQQPPSAAAAVAGPVDLDAQERRPVWMQNKRAADRNRRRALGEEVSDDEEERPPPRPAPPSLQPEELMASPPVPALARALSEREHEQEPSQQQDAARQQWEEQRAAALRNKRAAEEDLGRGAGPDSPLAPAVPEPLAPPPPAVGRAESPPPAPATSADTEGDIDAAEAGAAEGHFVLGGEALLLPAASEADSVAGRVEALRIYLEEKLGLDKFLRVYKRMDGLGAEDDEEAAFAQILGTLGPDGIGFVSLVHQLLVCEDSVFSEGAAGQAAA